jgi:hypothetical protein
MPSVVTLLGGPRALADELLEPRLVHTGGREVGLSHALV